MLDSGKKYNGGIGQYQDVIASERFLGNEQVIAILRTADPNGVFTAIKGGVIFKVPKGKYFYLVDACFTNENDAANLTIGLDYTLPWQNATNTNRNDAISLAQTVLATNSTGLTTRSHVVPELCSIRVLVYTGAPAAASIIGGRITGYLFSNGFVPPSLP